jgi:4'-phosphopantetheinyl transferase EntD
MRTTEGSSLFRPLLPAPVRLAEMPPAAADPDALPPEEQALIGRAVEKRRREFAAGRLLARSVLAEARAPVGRLLARSVLAEARAPVGPLLPDANRVPCWPAGIIGSITHCNTLCAVAVAAADAWDGLGLDVEPALPLEPQLLPMITNDVERERLQGLPPELRPIGGRLAFCIKEAVYKAIYPTARVFLDFHQVEILFEGDDGFVAYVLVPGAAPVGHQSIRGRFRVAHGHIAAAVLLPQARLPQRVEAGLPVLADVR